MTNFETDIFSQFHQKWALVSAGNMDSFNTMTISWGGLGTLWQKPVATIYVKPIRYTYEFLEKSDYFTISFFSQDYHEDLALLGRISGKDCDKIKSTKLTPKFLKEGVSFEEAEVTLVCHKIYCQDLDAQAMPAKVVEDYYQNEACHRMYIGEVVRIIKT